HRSERGPARHAGAPGGRPGRGAAPRGGLRRLHGPQEPALHAHSGDDQARGSRQVPRLAVRGEAPGGAADGVPARHPGLLGGRGRGAGIRGRGLSSLRPCPSEGDTRAGRHERHRRLHGEPRPRGLQAVMAPARPRRELLFIVVATLANAALAWTVFAVAGWEARGPEVAVRTRAGVSLVYFLLAFIASPLDRLWPGHVAETLRRYRRALGVTFGLSMSIHVYCISRLFRLYAPAQPPLST